ncbi:hypothetical protein BvCmsK120A_02176 [Escherichia coli]|nr:hypothetical protein BvCmsK120A_02176 [Escherichia coli]
MVSGAYCTCTAMVVTVTSHNPQIPAVSSTPIPLCDITTQLNHITITLSFQLTRTVAPAVMSSFMAHPHTGCFRFSGNCIDVLRLPQTFMKAGHKHGVCRSYIRGIGAGFRAQVVIMPFRSRFRIRPWFWSIFTTAQIPVSIVASRPTSKSIVISAGRYTSGLNKFSVSCITINMNNFNTIQRISA